VDWTAEDPGRTGVLGGAPALPDKPSIAVLPFANMSGDPEQEFFADGITEDIITALSRNRWFFVIARNSSFAYKGVDIDVKQVGRALGVRYVLEGSVRRAGNRVRVTSQLIEAETGAHIWAERYDRDYADIFAIQDEITESVVGAIEPELLMGEGRRAARRGAGNLDAFECAMRGMWHHYQFAREDLGEAERWLRRAIELDPKLARAHMGLARTMVQRCLLGWSTDIDGDLATMAAAAERAVALDDRDPYCHYALSASSLFSGRLALALSEAQHTIDLNPNFALGHLALGWVRIFIGHFAEAMEPLLRALRLSPHDPIAFMFLNRMALAQYHLGNYEEALHYAERALVGRRLYFVLVVALASLGRLGRSDEARPLLSEISAIAPADIDRYWDVTFPYANAAHREHFYEGLRTAGMRI
jgi:TolB-like protein/Flp pilus assembly protein TadD